MQVAFIWEDEQLRDEPPSGNPNAIDEFDYDSLAHIYSNNLPETRDIVLAGFDRTIKSYTDADGYPRYPRNQDIRVDDNASTITE